MEWGPWYNSSLLKTLSTILSPESPDGRKHYVNADCEDDIFSMAECLQFHLDGVRGTNSMIHDVYRELQRFAD